MAARSSTHPLPTEQYNQDVVSLGMHSAVTAAEALECLRNAAAMADPGINSGFKGMQLSITSLTCAIRQMAGPSSIHSLPTEQYNQDVVSLGMHSAVTAAEALECLPRLTT